MSGKPMHFLIFKIVGVVGIAVAIWGVVLAINGFDDFESNNFMIGGFLAAIGLFMGVSCTVVGLGPRLQR